GGGEVLGPRREEAGAPHQLEQLMRVAARGGVVLAQDLHGEQHVVEHVAPRHQARRLKHEAVVAHRPGDLAPADGDRPARLRDQSAHDAQQRRLAASARSEQRHELAGVELEAGVAERHHGLERGRAELLDRKDFAHVFQRAKRHRPASFSIAPGTKLVSRKPAARRSDARRARRLEYHVKYLMIFRRSNGDVTAGLRHASSAIALDRTSREQPLFRPLPARVTALAAVAMFLSCAAAQAQERDLKFVLDFISLGRHAPWYVALGKGYFKDEGLNVTIMPSKGTA